MRLNRVGEQNLFRQFGLFSFIPFLTFTISLYAQSFEDFKKTQINEYYVFMNKNDEKFDSYLKKQFMEYKAYKPIKLYKEEKPKSIFPLKPRVIEGVGPKIFVEVQHPKKSLLPKIETGKRGINFNYFGTKLGFNTPVNLKNIMFYPRNQKGISNFFEGVVSDDYSDLIKNIKYIKNSLNLNDWGVYQLVIKISNRVFSDSDRRKLLRWILFDKLGYDAKVGISDRHIILMFYSKKLIYATPNYTINNKKYYVLANYAGEKTGNVYTYDKNYPKAIKAFDLSLNTLPKFAKNEKSKTLHFRDYGRNYTIPFRYNQNLIDFMSTYPQADYATFFNAPMQNETYEDIASKLKSYMDGKHASSAINFLLHFVQKAFGYERDSMQFSREKVMFAEETLYYDKSDCEDRAVLFAYLVKKLLNIVVVGVKYKNHMTTALFIPMRGDSIKTHGRRVVIADPTYMNANVGEIMPKYKSIKPEKFILVNQ